MDGDRCPIGDLVNMADRYGAELIVDEAHAVGVLGPQGRGLVAEAGTSRRILAAVYLVARPSPAPELLSVVLRG